MAQSKILLNTRLLDTLRDGSDPAHNYAVLLAQVFNPKVNFLSGPGSFRLRFE
jgi:hypothetical protein